MSREAYEKIIQYRSLREQVALLEAERSELESALRLIEKSRDRRIYIQHGSVLIEVSAEEAAQYIRERLEIIELRLKQYRRKLEELGHEIREIII